MQLSIIIPLYNSDQFISKCIQSLLDQNIPLNTYEIIVVNDGSTDGSEEIVRSFRDNYENIVLINQSNKGNGAARNKGVEVSKGEYIYFIDSDDYLAKNVLNELLPLLKKYDLDILGFQSQVTDSSLLDNSENKLNNTLSEPVNGTQFVKTTNYRAEVWWYFVKRSFYEDCGIKFYDNKFVQDSYITTKLLLNADRILYVPLDAHRYRKHENSITKKKSPGHVSKHIRDLLFAIKKFSSLMSQVKDNDCLKRLNSRRDSYFFFLLLRFPKSDLNFRDLSKIIIEGKELCVYPMKHFIGKDYKGLRYKALVFILNNKLLLFPFMKIQRIMNRLN